MKQMLRITISVVILALVACGGQKTDENDSANLDGDAANIGSGAGPCQHCERTADCEMPLKCIGNLCVPKDNQGLCSDIERMPDVNMNPPEIVEVTVAEVTGDQVSPTDSVSWPDAPKSELTGSDQDNDSAADITDNGGGEELVVCEPFPEVCDGADNNCDGVADEWPACNNQGNPDFVTVANPTFPPVSGTGDVDGEVAGTCVDVDGDGALELVILTEAEKPLNGYNAQLLVFEFENGSFNHQELLQTGMASPKMYEHPLQMACADRQGTNGLGGPIDLFVTFYEYEARIINLWPWPETPGTFKYGFGSPVGKPLPNNHGGMVCTVPGTAPGTHRLMSSNERIIRLDGNSDVLDLATLDPQYVPMSCAGHRDSNGLYVAISVADDGGWPAAHRLLWFKLEDDDSLTFLSTTTVENSGPEDTGGRRFGGELFVADANMDGLPDLFTCRYQDVCQWVRVYLQTPEGTFEMSDEEHNGEIGGNFAVADVDSDGDPDIATGKKQEVIRRNNGDGTFQYFNVNAISDSDYWGDNVWLCDLNGDNDPEYIQAFGESNSNKLRVTVLKGLQ